MLAGLFFLGPASETTSGTTQKWNSPQTKTKREVTVKKICSFLACLKCFFAFLLKQRLKSLQSKRGERSVICQRLYACLFAFFFLLSLLLACLRSFFLLCLFAVLLALLEKTDGNACTAKGRRGGLDVRRLLAFFHLFLGALWVASLSHVETPL